MAATAIRGAMEVAGAFMFLSDGRAARPPADCLHLVSNDAFLNVDVVERKYAAQISGKFANK